MVNRYSQTWAELDMDLTQRQLGGDARTRARLVGVVDGLHYYQAVSSEDLRRQLLIELGLPDQVKLNDLPSWRGLGIEISHLDVAGLSNRAFLVLEQGLSGTERVYETVIEDLCEGLATLNDRQALSALLRDRLSRWQAFFSVHGFEGLSSEACRGLYGELWLIREYLIAALGTQRALQIWTGPEQAHQDFRSSAAALEVKTPLASADQRVVVASEHQLDDVGLQDLYLAVLSVAETAGGETLLDIVGDLGARFQTDPLSAVKYQDCLRSAGYLQTHAPSYKTGYAFRAFHVYRVGPEFPRLIDADLPSGVSRVTYSVSLVGCPRFEATMEQVLTSLR